MIFLIKPMDKLLKQHKVIFKWRGLVWNFNKNGKWESKAFVWYSHFQWRNYNFWARGKHSLQANSLDT